MATTLPMRTRQRRQPSPSAQLRDGEQMRVRLGMIAAMLLTLAAGAALFSLIR